MANNPYFRFSKISEDRFLALLQCFAADCTATQAAASTGLSLRSVNAIFMRIRNRISEYCCSQSANPGSSGSAAPAEGSRVLGIFDWEHWLCLDVVSADLTRMMPNLSRGFPGVQWIVTLPEWPGYHALGHFDLGWLCRLVPGRCGLRSSAVEDLWRFTRERVKRFYGVHDQTFGLHMKECEFRFNHLGDDLTGLLADLLMANPL